MVIVHWISAVLILVLFPLGKYVEELEGIDKLPILKIHFILGIFVLVLSIVRVYFYYKHKRPTHLITGNDFIDKLVVWNHRFLYYLFFIITVSGMVAAITTGYGEAVQTGDLNAIKPHDDSFILEIHEISAFIIMLMIAMHVVGVIKHFILTKEKIIKRMFP